MEATFKFTVTLSHQMYTKLVAESREREGSNGAVPSRTARQLIEERLNNIDLNRDRKSKKEKTVESEEEKEDSAL